jgi:translation initiation factor IF-3
MKDGQQLGIMPTNQARTLAQEEGLDLVEMVPTAEPPVCHIVDYGKWKYEQSIKKKEQTKNNKQVLDKEIQFTPGIGDHDVETKLKKAREFLEQGHKVQFVVQYKGRENAHKDLGFKLIDSVIEKLADVASVEGKPRLEGKRLFCRIEPLKKSPSAKKDEPPKDVRPENKAG